MSELDLAVQRCKVALARCKACGYETTVKQAKQQEIDFAWALLQQRLRSDVGITLLGYRI